MTDDLRNHDPSPNAEECAWMATDALGMFMRAFASAVVALTIGVTASVMLAADPAAPALAGAIAQR
ncbi:MAG TPA: hypothetical protein VEC19_15165 [Usitatibacter sp.]|nr:hypothetical protein [Usitatibacter sp.]